MIGLGSHLPVTAVIADSRKNGYSSHRVIDCCGMGCPQNLASQLLIAKGKGHFYYQEIQQPPRVSDQQAMWPTMARSSSGAACRDVLRKACCP